MKKKGLLPRLALNGILRNSSTYLPYIGISVFAMFTYFVFDIIINNKIMTTLPRATYAHMLMMVGFVLLGIIMVPFLYYTNSFLIKRRKKELGLYSILGMEKKHIGILMLIETLIMYAIVVICAIVLGLLFSRLIFLLLLNLTKLPVEASFSISGKAIAHTILFYAVISAINLFTNLVQVGKANPTELMSESKKGEKEPKRIQQLALGGVLLLGYGYYIAISSQVDASIFTNFFLAVFLVVMGTHFLFTSGSIAFLKRLKSNKRLYYRSGNFIAISGMIYRMKKNAASLVNICIFATMVLITMICTVSLYLGIPKIQNFMYPYDIEIEFKENVFTDKKDWQQEVETLAKNEGVTIESFHTYEYARLNIVKKDDKILIKDDKADFRNMYQIRLIPLDSYNTLDSASYELEQGEVLVYSTGADYGMNKIRFINSAYQVKKEIKESSLKPKATNNVFSGMYFVIVPDRNAVEQIAAAYGVEISDNLKHVVEMKLQGDDAQKKAFSEKLNQLSSTQTGFAQYSDYADDIKDTEVMYGGLLFIGIFFGIIFMMCLLIIMYYKQITEGFDDQKNYEIMQKVGMSDLEVKRTIKKQVLQVFFIPLAGAILHTIVGMFMVINLMAAMFFFQINLIIACTIGVCVLFAIIYGISYKRTAKAYYRIVKQWGV
ncbi:hypothetical protein I5677_04825 [Mobilitalea sibirica]|uniref:ABC3 transporter permease C-terminal domain-containing protein n=1 Tax=Mobilitalea sibirica TaxID=1462919 RepID=A0A8J7HCU4_9FIRM|nr:FtsX-like permease family protein [Mobilitalea sibirica]MBH1940219.1 hypothetical protein [Mobilitalea sibirica]